MDESLPKESALKAIFDLIAQFGEQYRSYRDQVRMLVPGRRAP
jgi:hypothetical protein